MSPKRFLFRTQKGRHILVGLLTALLFISYAAQFISWLFGLEIFGISFRTIFSIIAILYLVRYGKEFKAFVKKQMKSAAKKKNFFVKLDDTSGLDKIKLLQAHDKEKKRAKAAQKKELNKL